MIFEILNNQEEVGTCQSLPALALVLKQGSAEAVEVKGSISHLTDMDIFQVLTTSVAVQGQAG